jgi:hypothetical protein
VCVLVRRQAPGVCVSWTVRCVFGAVWVLQVRTAIGVCMGRVSCRLKLPGGWRMVTAARIADTQKSTGCIQDRQTTILCQSVNGDAQEGSSEATGLRQVVNRLHVQVESSMTRLAGLGS